MIVGRSVIVFAKKVFEGEDFPEGVNDTLISLIPKKPHPELITQFRPASLCNTSYELVTKILVERMRAFLDDHISPYQSSFIPGRRGSDNVILLREAITAFKHKKKKERGHDFKA